jgi:integrase/recombinase XerD
MHERVSTGDPVDVLVDQFRVWLAEERGLSPATVCCYGKQARMFLRQLPKPLEPVLAQLDPGQVTSLVLDYCRGHNTGSAQAMVTSLRALLRFLHVAGKVPVPLAAAVPAVAGWRLASLPRDPDDVGAVGVTRRRGRRSAAW